MRRDLSPIFRLAAVSHTTTSAFCSARRTASVCSPHAARSVSASALPPAHIVCPILEMPAEWRMTSYPALRRSSSGFFSLQTSRRRYQRPAVRSSSQPQTMCRNTGWQHPDGQGNSILIQYRFSGSSRELIGLSVLRLMPICTC